MVLFGFMRFLLIFNNYRCGNYYICDEDEGVDKVREFLINWYTTFSGKEDNEN